MGVMKCLTFYLLYIIGYFSTAAFTEHFIPQKRGMFPKYLALRNDCAMITEILEHAKENRVWGLGGISIFRKQNALTTHSDAF